MQFHEKNLTDKDFAQKLNTIIDHLLELKARAESDNPPIKFRHLNCVVFLGMFNEEELGLMTASRTRHRLDTLFLFLNHLRELFSFKDISNICDLMDTLEQLNLKPLTNYEAFIKSCLIYEHIYTHLSELSEELNDPKKEDD